MEELREASCKGHQHRALRLLFVEFILSENEGLRTGKSKGSGGAGVSPQAVPAPNYLCDPDSRAE